MLRSADSAASPVHSHTEWDPLEEVIVGSLDGAVIPAWQDAMRETMPESAWSLFRDHGGELFDPVHVRRAEHELEGLVALLEREGVRVRRPDAMDHGRAFSTPDWSVAGGLYAGMPRDGILVAGDLIIEAPMSWRCRHHEMAPFRRLFREYAAKGARWLAAPPPELRDELYERDGGQWAVNETEPVFDAADFLRFGADLVAQRSHVTNHSGIDWVRQVVDPGMQVHTIPVDDPHAMHIDATLMPLAPGKLLVNPDRFVFDPLFEGWDIRSAPRGTTPPDWPMWFCSSWVSMNLLSLDPETVVVEQQEQPLIEMLTEWGLRCLPIPFRHVYSLGGSFHCVTADIARASMAASYLRRPAG